MGRKMEKELIMENIGYEIQKCQNSFEYFYNNYCKREGMPEYSEEVYQDYLEEVKYIIGRRRKGRTLYPLTPSEVFKNKI